MPTFVNRLAPQAILMAFAIYWIWPSLMQPAASSAPAASKDKKGSAALDFSAALLSPTFPPAPNRDPFDFPNAKRAAKKGKSRTKDIAKLKGGASAFADANDSGLVLGATCIVGQQRLALINGEVYKEKDTIKGKVSGDEPVSWVITDILPHKVLLLHQGTPLQLGYTNGAAKPAAKSADASKNPAQAKK
jgi:hypothetical protein